MAAQHHTNLKLLDTISPPANRPADDAKRSRRPGRLTRLLLHPETGGLVSAVAAFVIFAILAGSNGFLTELGVANWLDTAADLAIVALAVGMLMTAGEFDLSVGAVAGAASITIGICTGYYGVSVWVGVAIALVIGLLIGLVNGLIVTKTRLPSFIVTLASMLMISGGSLGIANALTGSSSISATVGGFAHSLFAGSVQSFNASIVWALVLGLLATWVMRRTRFGNWAYATGGDQQAARENGVPTDFVKVTLFVCSSLSAVLVGIIDTIAYSNGSTTLDSEYNFTAIAAAVIGGVLLTGGYGTTIGILFGSATYGIVSVGVYYLGWDPNLAQLFIGFFMLVAVLANSRARQLALTRSS